ncbi:NAD(P)-binding domain-containing protein [Polaromonas sp. UC242_47]|uniref:NAD(P)-binding domain-containing protein n=1 Tax=Polaromonas sp. UC242_47 TaxID=3374626 RepID=UPI0037AEC45A
MHAQDPLDLIIVGGGIGGVISLYYAKKAGLKVLLIEKQPGVGGLWAQLPAWQDIQINPVDWALGDIPISGPLQASIARHIQAWVDKFDLASSMLLDTAVTTAKESPEGWTVTTAHQRYFSRFLIAATGGHNRAFTPRTERINASIQEYHSSALDDPQVLTGKDVLVVGGGASAYDLLDLCFEHQARRVVWLYRSLKWMLPTRKPKHIAGDIRGLAKQQMSGVSIAQMNRDINLDLQGRYEKFGLQDILPAGEFDITRDQLIPGRRAMIENFSKIERHQGEIAQIADRTVQISSGERIDVDLILWGTGYAMDLRYFESPALAAITRVDELAARCGCLFRSLDAAKLFFLAVGLEATGSAPWAYAHAARTIMSHIQGKAQLDEVPVQGKINHFESAKFLAPRDPENYPAATWFAAYKDMALTHPAEEPMPIP